MNENFREPIASNGIHLPGTQVWFDPSRPAPFSLISHHSLVARGGYRKALTTPMNRDIIRATSRRGSAFAPLVGNWATPFTLGDLTTTLFPAGFGRGGSQFCIQRKDHITLYSGLLGDSVQEDCTPFALPEHIDWFILRTETLSRCCPSETEPTNVKNILKRLVSEDGGTTSDTVWVEPEIGLGTLVEGLEKAGISYRLHPELDRCLPFCVGDIQSLRYRVRKEKNTVRLLPWTRGVLSDLRPDNTPGFHGIPLLRDESLLSYLARLKPLRIFVFGPCQDDVARWLNDAGMKAESLFPSPQLQLGI